MQDCFYTVNNKRVTGIVPALETHHDIRILGKEVDDFPFPLISPLCSNDRDIQC